MNLRGLEARLRALGKLMPPLAGAVLLDAPLSAEAWEEMLALEARLLAGGQAVGLAPSQVADFLRWMPALRAARSGEVVFAETTGIDMKRELTGGTNA